MANSKGIFGYSLNRGYVVMLEPDEQDIEKFLAEKRRNDLSEHTIRMYVRQMTELEEHTNKPFREATEDDINRLGDMKVLYCEKGLSEAKIGGCTGEFRGCRTKLYPQTQTQKNERLIILQTFRFS